MSKIDVDSINDLAQHIRQVNGNNDMGATKLSESILEWQATRAQTVPNEHGKNRYGLDMAYFRNLFNCELNRPLTDFRPDELARVLARAARAADKTVLQEPEFQADNEALRARVAELEQWQAAAFDAHPNIDIDIDRVLEHQSVEGGEWVRCEERLPTEADSDALGFVWTFSKGLGVTVLDRHSFTAPPFYTHWKPTGLTRPQPPKSKEGQ